MKQLRNAVLSCFLCLCTAAAFAQQQTQQIGCIEPGLRQQAREMQQQFTEQGFEVLRDAMIHMSSNTPFPVVVDLQKGVFYHILFIGNTRARKLVLEIYDDGYKKKGDSKKIISKTSLTGKDEANYISFSFMPEKSGEYVFSLLQQMKLKDFCGSFTIMVLQQKETTNPMTDDAGKN